MAATCEVETKRTGLLVMPRTWSNFMRQHRTLIAILHQHKQLHAQVARNELSQLNELFEAAAMAKQTVSASRVLEATCRSTAAGTGSG